MIYISQIIILYTLSLYSAVCLIISQYNWKKILFLIKIICQPR